MGPNNSFKPNLFRYGFGVTGKACHTKAFTTQVGLTQALGVSKARAHCGESCLRAVRCDRVLYVSIAQWLRHLSVSTMLFCKSIRSAVAVGFKAMTQQQCTH